MKKLLVFALMAMFTLGTQAQIVSSRSTGITKVKTQRAHNIWLEAGAGALTGDWEDTGLGIDFGARWTKMFTENVGWDIIKINAMTDTSHFMDALNVQFKTGIRGVSPVLFGNSSLYGAFSIGYGLFTDEAESALVWEIGAGLNVTPRFSVGIAYNAQNYTHEYKIRSNKEKIDIKGGYVSLKLAYAL